MINASSYTNSTLFHNYPKIANKEDLSKIADLVCQAEELRNFAYSNQEWDTFETHYCVLGTVIPMSLIGEITTENLSYPPSTLNAIPPITFEQLEEDALRIIEDISIFEEIYDPIKACKLGLINQTKKKRDAKLKQLRKLVKAAKAGKS